MPAFPPLPPTCTYNVQKNVFHKVRDQQQLLAKVCAVPGDITLPRLGLSSSTTRQLQGELHIVLHTAADIRLECDIHSALTSNYCGTKAVLELATGCRQLRALVHTSSCFVNMNQPASSVVDSRIYPLQLGDRTISCHEFVQVRAQGADTRLRHLYPHSAGRMSCAPACRHISPPQSASMVHQQDLPH